MQKPRRGEATTTTARQQQPQQLQQLQLSTRLFAAVWPNCLQHQKHQIQYATTCQEGQVSFRRRGAHSNALLSSSTIKTKITITTTEKVINVGLITKLVSLSLDRWFLRGKSHRKEFWRIPDTCERVGLDYFVYWVLCKKTKYQTNNNNNSK